jgi:hypothetical protein
MKMLQGHRGMRRLQGDGHIARNPCSHAGSRALRCDLIRRMAPAALPRPRPDDKKVPCRPVILRRQRRALRGSRANRVAATLNPKTTDKQFEALVARMMAKGWKDSTVGVVRDFRRAVLEQAAAKDEKATA